MQLRDLILIVDDGAADDAIVNGALATASRHDAHLAIVVMSVTPIPGYTFPVFPLATTIEEMRDRADAKVRRIEAAATRAGVPAEVRIVSDRVQDLLDKAPVQTRYADLVMFGPASTWEDDWMRRRVAENVLLRSGRPQLFLPCSGAVPSFERAVIGWNASDEAARALHAAMPFLRDRAEVIVAVINASASRDSHGSEPGVALARHLTRHGLRVTVDCSSVYAGGEADALRDLAIARGADLLILGAYARSRIRELLLGGVTHTLMTEPALPTLMMH